MILNFLAMFGLGLGWLGTDGGIPTPTPPSVETDYVAEDGTTLYVAEDGTT